MVQTYNGKSPRNARIKIDYTGECPSVQFKYPRKDGYEGSMDGLIFFSWFVLMAVAYIFFGLGIMTQASSQSEIQINDTQINNTNATNNSVEETKEETDVFSELLNLHPLKSFAIIFLFILVLFIPPTIICRIFKKKLDAIFPVYQAWGAKKKYVEFKTKDIKTSKINGKEEIYVEIPYFENVILKYEATKDFSKYLDVMEIKEHNFKTEEYSKKKEKEKKKNGKKKKSKKVKKQNEWYWNAKFYFSEIPKNGKLKVIFS